MNKGQLLTSVAAFAFLGMWAMPAAAQTPASSETDDAEIVVFGKGETRQVQTVTAVDIAVATPGTSPLKVLEKLPGVSFQSANALGSNEWSSRISIRGFNQNQLGFTLDGVPLGDMSYHNFNGLHISRAIASENIGRTTLAQGSGALSTASSSNLGGTVQFFSKAPSPDFGLDGEVSYGSENAYRLFGRLETGDLGNGIMGYVSGSWLDAPKWKGQGKQEAWSINSKLVVPLGERGQVAAFVNYSDFKDDDYMDMSLSLIRKYGWNWDYIRNDYPTAMAIATNLQNGVYCANYAGYSQQICGDDTYYDAYGLRKDFLAGANIDYELADAVTLKLTPYYHRHRGISTWFTPYTPTPGGSPMSVRGATYAINRGGATGSLSFTFGDHQLEIGGWYEYNRYRAGRPYFPLAASNVASIGKREWPKNPFASDYSYNFKIKTYQYFIQDTWNLTPELKMNYGFKGIRNTVINEYNPANSPNRDTSGLLRAKDMFIPQIGVNYAVSRAFELFASYTENMRAFTTEPFLTSRAGFLAVKDVIKPETSWTLEGGLRFHLRNFEGSIAGYHVKFDDRLLSVQPCAIIIGCPSILSNVGSVTTNGIEMAGTYRLTRALSLYGAYAYTDAQYDDDILSGVLYATKNKTVVNTPKHLINGEIAYDDGALFGRISANYQSKRYYTYINDNSVKGRALVDLSAGYRFPEGGGLLDGLELQANVTNLFDKKYISTVGQTALKFSDPGGNVQSMLVGTPRQVFLSLRKHF
ncbi:TonB-dependent receptor [Rhizorhabdus wittichii RW1]|uniref:TonB-dependent receptor n=1 Tax=Rhizorhabdus wittichii (strain DSM 6014 / CCUG 31198 / JCM 15750 / NBRC 105917 / EY 4224 / RW1) TaxID=392499 RepID=A0A9J9HFZ8_RHIWR|nr:TonB-dependent receptor [Rhizorhabdus wittichii RW1]